MKSKIIAGLALLTMSGMAITMLLMGGGIGVAQNSPMPALSGIAGAAFLHWGPQIIKQLMANGGVF